MLPEPKCYLRGCVHFRGFDQPDGTERSERFVCAAFPDGIPQEIAFGENPHAKPVPGDHGIQFKAGPLPEQGGEAEED